MHAGVELVQELGVLLDVVGFVGFGERAGQVGEAGFGFGGGGGGGVWGDSGDGDAGGQEEGEGYEERSSVWFHWDCFEGFFVRIDVIFSRWMF